VVTLAGPSSGPAASAGPSAGPGARSGPAPSSAAGAITATARIVAERGADGATRLPVLASQVPLVLRRTPEAVYLVGGAAGPLGGDSLRLCVDVGAGAMLRIRSAAASIALPSTLDGPSALGDASAESVLRVDATVGAGGCLEFMPEPVVVADGARHRVEFCISLAADARLVLREEIILGRHGERGGACVCRLLVDLGCAPLLRQEVAVSGTDEVSLGPAVLAGHRAFGSLLIVGPGNLPAASGAAASVAAASVAEGLAVMPLNDHAVLLTAIAGDALTLRRRLTG
jgi:urease accessory protein